MKFWHAVGAVALGVTAASLVAIPLGGYLYTLATSKTSPAGQ